MKYYNRSIEKTIVKLINDFRVIGLTGPRQSGKSTMIKHILGEKYKYVSFDKYSTINEFQNNPAEFISKNNKYIIFDEVQNVPEIFNYIKSLVDDEPDIKGRFILTGSSQFTLNKNITESLAGRIGLITLLPMDYNEINSDEREKSIFYGSYPELIVNKFNSSEIWYDSYITTYIERDVRKLENVGDLRDFQRFLALLSSYAGKQINFTEISKSIGISINTVKRWLSILEASYIIFFLSPYYKNFNKRITKTPKLYFYDTGLSIYLSGMYGKMNFEMSKEAGPFFENYIVSDVIKQNFHNLKQQRIYFYRTSKGDEADLLIESGLDLTLVEVKSASNYTPALGKQIEKLDIPVQKRIVVYRGEDIKIKDNFSFVNFNNFLKLP